MLLFFCAKFNFQYLMWRVASLMEAIVLFIFSILSSSLSFSCLPCKFRTFPLSVGCYCLCFILPCLPDISSLAIGLLHLFKTSGCFFVFFQQQPGPAAFLRLLLPLRLVLFIGVCVLWLFLLRLLLLLLFAISSGVFTLFFPSFFSDRSHWPQPSAASR